MIDADAFRNDMLSRCYIHDNDFYKGMAYERNAILEMLADTPAADVAPVVHGKWIHKPGQIYSIGNCSFCDYPTETIVPYNFCPNCGADMREVQG